MMNQNNRQSLTSTLLSSKITALYCRRSRDDGLQGGQQLHSQPLYAVLADSDIMQHYPYSFDEARVRNWIIRNIERYEKDGFGLWAVCLKSTGEMIGDCGITMQNIHGQMLPEIGYHMVQSRKIPRYGSSFCGIITN